MNNNSSKVDSYGTPESLWGDGVRQGKKASDLSGESCLTSVAQLVVAQKNRIVYSKRVACLLIR